MKTKYYLLFSFIFLGFSLMGKTQEKESDIPKSILKSPASLANHLVSGASDDRAKVDAVYEWIINNIAYDVDELNSDEPFEYKNGSSILKKKEAICTGYAGLMQEMLYEVGIESEVVDGYVHSPVTDTLVLPVEAIHSWLAVKINGNWFLTDPTWGAGYVGNTKTDKEEVFGKKRAKLEKKYAKKDLKLEQKKYAAKDDKQEAKIIEKIEAHKTAWKEAKEALEKDYKEEKDFTGERGFVKEPSYTFHLVTPDSFLLSHLPINPMWQLKSDTIGIMGFAKGEEFMKSRTYESDDYPFDYAIEDYQKLLIHEKLIWSADDGFLYHNTNFALKVVNYFNYLSIVTDKKIQEKIGSYDREDVTLKLDTVFKYLKLAKTSSKSKYKVIQKYFKKLEKEDRKRHSALLKTTDKLKDKNADALADIDKRNTELKAEQKTLAAKIEKLQAKVFEPKSKVDLSLIEAITDSLKWSLFLINRHEKRWLATQDSSYLQDLMNVIGYNQYLYKLRNRYLSFQDYQVNKFLIEVDSIIDINNVKIVNYYEDSLAYEMLKKDWYKAVKDLGSFENYTKTKLNELKVAGKIKETPFYLNYIQQVILAEYKKMLLMNEAALEHNNWMKARLKKQFSERWREVKQEIREMESLNEKRYETSQEDISHELKRSEALYDKVEVDCKKLKVEVKK